MKSYELTLKSLSPYMQHRMDDMKLADWEKYRGKIIERANVSEEALKQAEYHCYRNADGQCYIPAEHFRGALIAAGTYSKGKVGGRSKSMKTIVAATFLVAPDEILLPDFDEIDKRSAVNNNVKARIMVIRPKWSSWEAKVILNCYEETITTETIKQIFVHAGSYVGIGSYRPTNSGLFGRFEVVSIKELKDGK